MNKIFYVILILGILGVASFFVPPVSAAPVSNSPAVSVTSPQLQITSTMPGISEDLYLPENSSHLNMFYDWNITVLSAKAFSIAVNGIVVSTGAGPITVSENMSKYSEVNVTIKVGITVYTYSDISIIGVPPKIGIFNVLVTSQYPGQDQTLAVKQGVSGQLTYPEWAILLESSDNESYSVYENGLLVDSGHVLGSRTIDLNITGNSTSVIVSLGNHIFNYKNELVAHIPISKYYAPKPPALVATALDVALSLARGMVIVLLSVISGMFLARKAVMAKMDSEPQRRL